MTVVLGLGESEQSILVLEDPDTGHVTLEISNPDGDYSITVEPAELARALVEASPTFAKGLGEIAQRAILNTLGRDA
jgi:hypothetical protein